MLGIEFRIPEMVRKSAFSDLLFEIFALSCISGSDDL